MRKILIRDDGVVFGYNEILAKHHRFRVSTIPDEPSKEVPQTIEEEVVREKLPPIPELASRPVLMQYIRDNFGTEPNPTKSINDYRKQIAVLAKRNNKEL